MLKKVVLINQSTGYLMIDIVNAFTSEYDEVVLIAGTIKTMERELNKKVHLKKIMAYKRTSGFKRLFSWIWAGLQVFFLLLYKYRHYEIVYFTNPPVAYLSSLLLQNKFSVVVYDTYPDALKNIGIKENNLIYRLWSKWNKTLFNKADKITTLSESMANQLSVYVSRNKIKVIPNWSGSEKFAPVHKDKNIFAANHKLSDKFIVMYSGNIGFTHSVETIIEVAINLKNYESVHFVIIGEGMKKTELIKQTELNNLKNCTFLSWQSKDILHYSLATADLAVVSLNDETATLSVPSKTYNLLATGAPLLCIAPENSELAALVDKFDNGVSFTKNNINGIAEFIINLSTNKTEQHRLSDNSLIASRNFSFSNARYYL